MTSIRCFLSRVAAGIQACKFAAIPVLALTLALVTTSAKAQTFKSDFATQVVLAGGGTDPVNTLTLLASPSTIPLMLTFPNAATAGTYVLSSDGSGHLVWANGSAGITLGGDVTGAANNNTIASTAGPDIAVAINAGAASAIHGSQVNPNFVAQNVSTTGTISGDGITSTVATGNALSLDNTGTPGAGVNDVTGTGGLWYVTNLGAATFASVNAGSGAITTTGAISGGGLTNTGAATTSGGTVSINSATNEADNTNIDASPATGGTNDIGNSGSTTNIAGAVDFTGTVSIPAGDLNIGLATNNIFVGNLSNIAAPLAPSTSSVLVTDGSGNVSWGRTLPSGLIISGETMNNETIGGTTTISTSGAIATTSTLGAGATTVASLASTGAVSGTTGTFTGAVSGTTGTFTGAVSTSSVTNTGAATTSGGTVSINSATNEADNTNIDASPATGGTNDIGNSGSTTNIAGAVDFTGTVSIPAGDLNIGLATNNIFVGNLSNIAAPLAPSTSSVLVTDGSGNVSWGTTLPSGLIVSGETMNNETIGGSTSISTTGNIATTGTGTLTVAGNTSLSTVSTSGLATLNSLTTASATITGGTIDGTAIGSTNPSTGAFTNLTSTGNTNINTPASAGIVVATTNIDAGPGQEGVVNIGNNGGATPADSSTTNIAGALNISGATNFTGPVNIPAGDLNLGLATNNIYIGNGSNIATGAPVTGDVSATLTSGNAVLDVNSVQTAAGNSIVAAINGSTTNLSNTGISITAGAITGSSLTTTGAVDGGTGVFTSTVSAAGVTSTAGLTSGGGSSNLNNADNDAVNIGSGASETNAIAIGNGTGNSGTFSTTTLAGLIDITGDANFTGPVNIPAGDLNLGLAQNNIFVGNISNIAAPLAPTDSRVLVTDVSGNVSWGSTLPTGLTVSGETMNNETIGGTTSISTSGSIATTGSGSLSVAGQTTLASTNLSSQGVTAAATTALSNGSFFQLTCLSSVAITTLTGGNIGTAGQIIVLLNANATGSGSYITLTAGGTLALNGGNVIMGPGGSATLISDGTNWHLMSAE